MAVATTPVLSPRDLAALGNLKEQGLFLVEIKVTEYSPVLGRLLLSIPLPDNTRPICVIRGAIALLRLETLFLEESDIIYLLSDDEDSIRNIFTVLQ